MNTTAGANIRVSVVTISRNCIAELKKTVASVLDQGYPNLEFIVVDGLSNDGTREFLESKGSAIRWISESDQGIADAFNKGARMATGDTLVFLNAGDTFVHGGTVEEVIQRIPSDVNITGSVIYGNYYTVDGHEKLLLQADHQLLDIRNSINHQSAFAGRDIYQRFTYDERLFLGMDYDYWLRCRAAGAPFIKVEVTVSHFDQSGRSSSLHYRVHNHLIRFILRAINSRRMLTPMDAIRFLGVALNAWARVLFRRYFPAKTSRKSASNQG